MNTKSKCISSKKKLIFCSLYLAVICWADVYEAAWKWIQIQSWWRGTSNIEIKLFGAYNWPECKGHHHRCEEECVFAHQQR